MLDFDHAIMVNKDMGQFSLNSFTVWNLTRERIEDMHQTKELLTGPFYLAELWVFT